MKKQISSILLPILIVVLSSYSVHKFHVGLYQINYASEKKMLQITSRIHIEDLNKALERKHKTKISIGDEKETPEDLKILKDYLAKNVSIKVNGQLINSTAALSSISGYVQQEDLCIGTLKVKEHLKFQVIFNFANFST